MHPSQEQIAGFWYATRKINLLMERAGDKFFREQLGVGLSLFLVLSVIDARPGAFNQQQVATALGITKGTISRQIELGIAAGYIRTDPSPTSRRDNLVSLTESGTALVRRGDEALASRQEQVFGSADGTALEDATRVINALIANMEV